MTSSGLFEVTAGGRSERFALLDEALVIAHEWLRRAQELRELSTRIEQIKVRVGQTSTPLCRCRLTRLPEARRVFVTGSNQPRTTLRIDWVRGSWGRAERGLTRP